MNRSLSTMDALQDDSKNGCLQVIPGSHKLNGQLRSPSLPVDFENPTRVEVLFN